MSLISPELTMSKLLPVANVVSVVSGLSEADLFA